MRTTSLLLSIAVTLVPFTAAACAATAGDAASADTDRPAASATPLPAGATPSASVAPTASAAPDASTPQSTPLVADPNVVLLAVTGDDRAVYLSQGTLAAIPLAGGAPDVILAKVDASTLTVTASGPEVLVWDGGANGVGPLSAWSKKTGTVSLSTASAAGLAAVSPDGAWIAFADDATPLTGSDSGGENLVIATADGSSRTALDSSQTTSTCTPSLSFATSGALFAEICAIAGVHDGLPLGPYAAVETFAGPSWRGNVVANEVQDGAWAFDPSGTFVWAPLSIAPEDGELFGASGATTPTVVDTGAEAGYFGSASSLFYSVEGGTLKHLDTTDPAKSLAPVASGVRRVYGLAPDGVHIAYATSFTGNSAFDLYVASASGGAPTAIVATDLVTSASFSTSSQYVAYVESVPGAKTVYAQPVGGGPALLLGASPWQVSAAEGSAFALGLNAVKDPTAGWLADVALADASGKNPVKTLATQARAGFLLSPDLARVVYVAPAGAAPGLYAAGTT